MRTVQQTLYTAAELKEHDGEAFERARDRYNDSIAGDIPWMDETVESLKAVFAHAGIRPRDWSIGPCSPCYVTFDRFDGDDLTGPRAMAWLENRVFGPLRIPFEGPRRWSLAKYGEYYRPGMVKPCPFTGYCADEDYLESLREYIAGGQTIRDAFKALADVAGRLIESDCESATSEEAFLEAAEVGGWEFDEEGRRV